MAFEITRAETRINRMLTWFAGICTSITDFNVGSKFRSKLETVAVEMEKQDMEFMTTARRAIPAGLYHAFDHDIVESVSASGSIVFSRTTPASADIVIPAGTQVSAPATDSVAEKVYEVTANTTLATGSSSVAVSVACTAAGIIGNTGALTVTNLKVALEGIDSISNPSAFTNGAERETNDERRARFQEFIGNLHRGTYDAIVTGAKKAVHGTEIVTDVFVREPGQAYIGQVTCYIFNGANGASNDIIATAQNIIDGYYDTSGNRIAGYKAAGVVVDVVAATPVPTAVTVNVNALPNTDKTAMLLEIEAAIINYTGKLKIGQPCLRNELIERIMAVDGVYNLEIVAPAVDVYTEYEGQVITPGTPTVTFI